MERIDQTGHLLTALALLSLLVEVVPRMSCLWIAA
jgi:hypothetical protein